MSSHQVPFLRTVQAVLWSFIGIRKNSEGQEDMAKLNPFHVLVVGLCLALLDCPRQLGGGAAKHPQLGFRQIRFKREQEQV